MSNPSAINPIIMIGMGRSGSTVISEVISMHESIGWFSNYNQYFPNLWWTSIFSRIYDFPLLGYRIRGLKQQKKVGFIASLKKLMPRPEEPFLLFEKYLGSKIRFDFLANQSANSLEIDTINTLLRKTLKIQGKERLLIKLTGPPRICYLNSIFPNAFFVNIIRDPRAVISSLLRINFWVNRGALKRPWWKNGLNEEDFEEWQKFNCSSVAIAAIQWKRIHETAIIEKQLVGKRYFEINYERFVADPTHVIINLLNSVELPMSEKCLYYLFNLNKAQNMNTKFSKNLSPSDISVIEQITGKTAQKFGYFF